MNSTWLECFMAFAETGNVESAGRKLHFSAATVLRYIRALEKDLGVVLLEKNEDRRLMLTEAGVYYRSFFLASLYKLECIKNGVADTEPPQISVGVSDYLDVLGHIGRALQGYIAAHPEIQVSCVQMQNSDLVEKLMRGEIDVIVLSQNHLPQSVEVEEIAVGREQLCLVGPPELMGSEQDADVLRRRNETPYIYSDNERTQLERNLFLGMDLKGIPYEPTERLCVPNVHTMKASAAWRKSMCIADRNFGFLSDVKDLGWQSIHKDTSIYCCRMYNNDNENIPILIDHFRESFRNIETDTADC